MALSPSIPTSFVPKQPVAPGGKKRYSAANGIFLAVSLVIAALAIIAAGGVYLYANYLTSVEKAKGSELLAAQSSVNADTVQQFIDLRDQLSASKTLISQHVELSQFFTLLESITVQDVHFNSLTVTVADDNSAAITMMGQAASFNALAAESNAFAAQQNIQSAIFSGITVNKDNTIGFTLNATLAPALITEVAPPTTPVILSSSPATSVTPNLTSTAPAASVATTTAETNSGATSSSTTP